MNIGQFSIHDDTDLAMSRFNSIVLLVLYFFYLVFTMSEPAEEKNEEKSKLVSAADEVADGEIITMPFAMATFCRTAMVTPEQSAPTMALMPSEVIMRSAPAVAAAASVQVESARTAVTLEPFMKAPESVTSFIAISAASAIGGVSDSIGPVKPKMTPSLTL